MLKSKNNILNILSLNCQSLNSKYDEINIFLDQCFDQGCKIDIICLQETWIATGTDISLFNIANYNLISSEKSCSEHGGVAIYIHESLKSKIIHESANSKFYDGQFIEVTINNETKNSKKIIIGNIYRPPHQNTDDINNFMSEISQLLDEIRKNKNILLCGDFNINLLKLKEVNIVNNFLEFFLGIGFAPRITVPTRLSKNSGTLIDNFFIKISEHYSNTTAGVILSHISDHLPYFITLDYLGPHSIEKFSKKVVQISTQNISTMTDFKTDLQNTQMLLRNITADNADASYNKLDKIIQNLIDKHFPDKYEKFDKYKHGKCKWITNGILNSIKKKDKLYKILRSTKKSDKNYETKKINFQTYQRLLKSSIRTAKKNYYFNQFNSIQNNIRKTWTAINNIINKTRNTNDFPNEFIINDRIVTNKSEIANEFNNFFINTGSELSDELDTPINKSHKDYLFNPTEKSFNFEPIDTNTIIKTIDSLKLTHSVGYDRMSCKLLKLVKHELAIPLKLIINQSFESAVFPSLLKIAKIKPIHKKDSVHLLNNYRPISLLPIISKVFERIMYNQIFNHFTQNKLFYNSQYGFRQKHSTELASIEVVQTIINIMDKNELPLNIYIDLSKAFDSLNHKILLDKLKHYGIRGKSNDLLKNYLNERVQYVELNETRSNFCKIRCGVPQGSILGPLLFIIYVNDIINITQLLHPILYADDITLMTSINPTGERKEVVTAINKELNDIYDWLKTNKLSLNVAKTKCMVFHTPQRNVTLPDLYIHGKKLEFVQEFTFLGIILDKHLSWKPHINLVAKKISKACAILHKLKHNLPWYILRIIYNCLILPHLNYGLIIWGWRSNRLLTLQKRAIRSIANLGYIAHTSNAFRQLKILKLPDLCTLHDYLFCYKLLNNILPQFFYLIPFLQKPLKYYDTRQCPKYQTPIVVHEFAKNTLQYKIPVTLNKMPEIFFDKIDTHSMDGFKTYIKHKFLENYSIECSISNCYTCGFQL